MKRRAGFEGTNAKTKNDLDVSAPLRTSQQVYSSEDNEVV